VMSARSSRAQDCRLARHCLCVARDNQLQNCLGAVVAESLDDKRLGRIAVGAADGDVPVRLDRPDEERKLIDPSARPDRKRLLANNGRDLDHRHQ
jgi:hypothetical protein